ncbi:pilus assembly protein PilM [Candidatus Omnitrophota bacterium]
MKFKKTKETVVVEISNDLLKMVYAYGHQVKWTYHWPLGTSSDREIAEHIRSVFEKKKFAPAGGILSFSRNALTVGMLHFPSNDPQEIASMVEVNAVRQVPYPKSEIVLGWRVVFEDTSGFSDVLLAICQRALVRRHISILETAGLRVDDVQISSEGTVNWLLYRDKSVASSAHSEFILDIDQRHSDLIVISQGNLMMSRLIAHGAEFLKEAPGSGNTRYFINEFKQTMGMLPESLQEKKSNNLFLVGARQEFAELEEIFQKEFKLNVRRIEPPRENLVPENISFCGLLGIALGGPCRRIIFDIPEIKIKREWQRKFKQLVLLGGLITYIIVVLLVTAGYKIYKRQELLSQLQARYSIVSKEAGQLSGLMERIELIQDIKSPRGSLLYYLYVTSKGLPVGCQILNFDFQKDKQIVIRGQTEAISAVFDFVSFLEKSQAFKSVQTRYTRKVSGRDFQGSEFELVCLLKQ